MHRTAITPLLALAVSFGCAAESTDSRPGFGGKGDDLNAEDIPQLATQYAVDVFASVASCESDDLEACSDEEKTITLEGVARMTVEQDGADVLTSTVLCHFEATTDSGKTYSSDDGTLREGEAMLENAPAMVAAGRLVSLDGVAVLVTERGALQIGMDLDNPVDDELPDDGDDDGQHDLDDDGKPGVSIDAPVGRVFVGIRVISAFEAAVFEDGQLRGPGIDSNLGFTIFGDSIPFVNVRKKAEEALVDVIVTDQNVAFVLTEQPAASCADVLANR